MDNINEYTEWRPLKKLEELKGKTIQEIIEENDYYKISIFFTDKTYIVLIAGGEDDAYIDLHYEFRDYDVSTKDNNGKLDLNKIGKILNINFPKFKEMKKKEAEEIRKWAKANRYRQYLDLKKEFENN